MLTKVLGLGVVVMMAMFTPVQSIAEEGVFIVRQIDQAPDAFAQAVEDYSKKKEWNFLGSQKVKNGEITLVKFCVAEVGKQLWKQGLQMSALAPCGNIGVYQKDGKTEISVLNPRYMNVLAPSPEMEKISLMAEAEVLAMLDALAK